MVDEKGPHHFVMFQNPGPKWIDGVPYNEQPEFQNTLSMSALCTTRVRSF